MSIISIHSIVTEFDPPDEQLSIVQEAIVAAREFVIGAIHDELQTNLIVSEEGTAYGTYYTQALYNLALYMGSPL